VWGLALLRRFCICVVFGVLAPALLSAEAAAAPNYQDPQTLDRGYRQMYSLDFPAAHATFRSYQQTHPADPMGHVSNAAAYLFSEFDRLHILESDLFLDDKAFDGRQKLTPDPAVKTELEQELAKSDDLA